jgi:hypothetical protein
VVNSKEILNYYDAKRLIYLPAYKWVLENKLQDELREIKELLKSNKLYF